LSWLNGDLAHIFYLEQVGLIAINDGLVLRSQISRIFRRYFRGKSYYVDLLDLFNEVEIQTTSGQLLDQITTNEGRKDLNKYNVHVYATELRISPWCHTDILLA
jgi:farnesyl diphosphate synthase